MPKAKTMNRTVQVPLEVDNAVRKEIEEYNANPAHIAKAQYKSVVIDALCKRYGITLYSANQEPHE